MIDPSKYGVPIQDNEGFVGKTDVLKYGTIATPIPEKPKTSLGSKIKSEFKNFGKDALTYDAQGKVTGLKPERSKFLMESALGFTGASGAIKALKPKTIDLLKNTTETISKFEEATANLAGRIKTSLSGKKKILPSETEKRAAKILEGQISSNVTKNPQVIKKEITRKGQEVENYLVKNKVPITAQEQANMFSQVRKEMEKFATKTELKAYDEQMRTFLKQLPGRGGYTTDNYYKALKEFEENVTRNLPKGKSALFGDSQGIGSARIRAAQDVRKVVRDTISKKHPEFKNKMFDLASLYDVLDIALTKSRQLSGNTLSRFAENNPVLTNIAKIGAGIAVGKSLLGGNSERQSFSDINQ